MLAEPTRPVTVPPEALWSESDAEWIIGDRDAEGRWQGVVRYFRTEGTICCATEHLDGVPHGRFQRYHENGEISREGAFERGALEGTNVFYRCTAVTSESFPASLSERVWRAELDYRAGAIVGGRLFDREGYRVLEDGTRLPERPEGVPQTAHFDHARERWFEGAADEAGRREGTWRWWSATGVLVEVTEHLGGAPHGRSTTYHDDGQPAEDFYYENGARHGLYRAWNGRGEMIAELEFVEGIRNGAYRMAAANGDLADERVAFIEGTFEGDQSVGMCRLLDANGEVLLERDLGVYLDDQMLLESPVLDDCARPKAYWERVCGALIGARRFAEAMCAAARAVAGGADVRALRALLERHSIPRSTQGALAAYAQLRGEERLAPFVHAFVRGADPGHVLRHLSMLLDQRTTSHPAHAFVNTAIALEPDRHEYLFTRSLVRASIGWPAGARADARAISETRPDEHRFLAQYLHVLFPTFDFWPARTPITTTGRDDLPEVPARSLEEIRTAIQKYATRIARVRAAIVVRARATELSWMPPDTSHLIPNGPVELDVPTMDGTFTIEAVDFGSAEIPALLRFARDDWSALTWLCWSVGLDRVSLPETLRPRVDYRGAIAMATDRLWRCRDRVQTSGQVAESLGVAGFAWEGLDIDSLHPSVAQIAESEHAELVAMLTWLGQS